MRLIQEKNKFVNKSLKAATKENTKLIKVNERLQNNRVKKGVNTGKASRRSPDGILSPSPSPTPDDMAKKKQVVKKNTKKLPQNSKKTKPEILESPSSSESLSDDSSSSESSENEEDDSLQAILAKALELTIPDPSGKLSLPTYLSPPLSPMPPSPSISDTDDIPVIGSFEMIDVGWSNKNSKNTTGNIKKPIGTSTVIAANTLKDISDVSSISSSDSDDDNEVLSKLREKSRRRTKQSLKKKEVKRKVVRKEKKLLGRESSEKQSLKFKSLSMSTNEDVSSVNSVKLTNRYEGSEMLLLPEAPRSDTGPDYAPPFLEETKDNLAEESNSEVMGRFSPITEIDESAHPKIVTDFDGNNDLSENTQGEIQQNFGERFFGLESSLDSTCSSSTIAWSLQPKLISTFNENGLRRSRSFSAGDLHKKAIGNLQRKWHSMSDLLSSQLLVKFHSPLVVMSSVPSFKCNEEKRKQLNLRKSPPAEISTSLQCGDSSNDNNMKKESCSTTTEICRFISIPGGGCGAENSKTHDKHTTYTSDSPSCSYTINPPASPVIDSPTKVIIKAPEKMIPPSPEKSVIIKNLFAKDNADNVNLPIILESVSTSLNEKSDKCDNKSNGKDAFKSAESFKKQDGNLTPETLLDDVDFEVASLKLSANKRTSTIDENTLPKSYNTTGSVPASNLGVSVGRTSNTNTVSFANIPVCTASTTRSPRLKHIAKRRHSMFAGSSSSSIPRLRTDRTKSLSPSMLKPPSPPLSPIPPSPKRSLLTPIISPLPTTPLPDSVSPLPPSPKIMSPPLIRGTAVVCSENSGLHVPKPVIHRKTSAVKALKFKNQVGYSKPSTALLSAKIGTLPQMISKMNDNAPSSKLNLLNNKTDAPVVLSSNTEQKDLSSTTSNASPKEDTLKQSVDTFTSPIHSAISVTHVSKVGSLPNNKRRYSSSTISKPPKISKMTQESEKVSNDDKPRSVLKFTSLEKEKEKMASENSENVNLEPNNAIVKKRNLFSEKFTTVSSSDDDALHMISDDGHSQDENKTMPTETDKTNMKDLLPTEMTQCNTLLIKASTAGLLENSTLIRTKPCENINSSFRTPYIPSHSQFTANKVNLSFGKTSGISDTCDSVKTKFSKPPSSNLKQQHLCATDGKILFDKKKNAHEDGEITSSDSEVDDHIKEPVLKCEQSNVIATEDIQESAKKKEIPYSGPGNKVKTMSNQAAEILTYSSLSMHDNQLKEIDKTFSNNVPNRVSTNKKRARDPKMSEFGFASKVLQKFFNKSKSFDNCLEILSDRKNVSIQKEFSIAIANSVQLGLASLLPQALKRLDSSPDNECNCDVSRGIFDRDRNETFCPQCMQNRSLEVDDINIRLQLNAFNLCHPHGKHFHTPLVTIGEYILMLLLHKIQQRAVHMRNLPSSTLNVLRRKIFLERDMMSCERMALCRFYALICRFYNQLDELTTFVYCLCYDQPPHINFPMLLITCYAVWPSFMMRTDLLLQTEGKRNFDLLKIKMSPLTAVFQIIATCDAVTKKETTCIKILEKLFSISCSSLDVASCYRELVDELVCLLCSQELSFISEGEEGKIRLCPFVLSVFKAMALLCKRIGWESSYNDVLLGKVWHILRDWSEEKVPDDTAIIMIRLTGHLCKVGYACGYRDFNELARFFAEFLQKICETEQVPASVQTAVGFTLLDLTPSSWSTCLPILEKWLLITEQRNNMAVPKSLSNGILEVKALFVE